MDAEDSKWWSGSQNITVNVLSSSRATKPVYVGWFASADYLAIVLMDFFGGGQSVGSGLPMNN